MARMAKGNETGQYTSSCLDQDSFPTVLERLQAERQATIRKHNQRMRELNRVISLLETSGAEALIEEAESVLSGGRG